MGAQVTAEDRATAREWRRREACDESYEGQEERLAQLLARTRAAERERVRALVRENLIRGESGSIVGKIDGLK